MQIYWLRPSSQDLTASEIVLPKSNSGLPNKPTLSLELTKYPFNLSFEKTKEIIHQADFSILNQSVGQILGTNWRDWGQLQDDLEKLSISDQFFSIHVNSLFSQLIEQIFQKENQLYYIKTLILTIDYYMNLQTFLLFLYWKMLQQSTQWSLIEKILNALIKVRYICLNKDYQIEQFIHFLFENKVQIIKLKQHEIISQPIMGHETLDLLQIEPEILSNAITEINEEFYSQLLFTNLLTPLDKGKQTDFMAEYFNRINSFSLYIQMTVLSKKDRKKAIDYFYEVCLKLCGNEDGEGVFLLYTLSIERLDQDLLQSIQYISPLQQTLLLDMTKSFNCQKHIYTLNSTKKLYPISSFYYFWTKLKKIELILQQTKDIKHLESIRNILVDIMFVRQSNYARLQIREKHSDSFLKYFLTKGHQFELSSKLGVSNGNWNHMQLKIMKMA